jgi:CRISPR system Cascade subunit CasA
MYWGMPRRIRIDWQADRQGPCDICGEQDVPLIHSYVTRNHGINYSGPWQHPLSPHYIDNKTGEPLPMHAQSDGFNYRHWPGWVEETELVKPARVVVEFNVGDKRRLPTEQLRLWVFGYDMDNMKARCWYETTTPLILIQDEMQRKDFAMRVQEMVEAAERAAGAAQKHIKEAWFKRPGDARGDTAFLKEDFFQRTEGPFYAQLPVLKAALESGDDAGIVTRWRGIVYNAALRLFEDHAARGDIAFADPRRIAVAGNNLQKALRKLLKPSNHKEKAA